MALLATLSASSVAAQQAASSHEGVWVGFGVGGGYHLSGPSGARGGGAGEVRAGGTVTPWLLVGGEFAGWGRRQNETAQLRANFMTSALVYPAGPAAFVKGGVGLATESTGSTATGPATATNAGLGGSIGAGYDLQLRDNLFLTATLDFLFQVMSGRTASLAVATIGVTWH